MARLDVHPSEIWQDVLAKMTSERAVALVVFAAIVVADAWTDATVTRDQYAFLAVLFVTFVIGKTLRPSSVGAIDRRAGPTEAQAPGLTGEQRAAIGAVLGLKPRDTRPADWEAAQGGLARAFGDAPPPR